MGLGGTLGVGQFGPGAGDVQVGQVGATEGAARDMGGRQPYDDIDPTDINDVIWAMCTRCDPRDDVDIIRGCWSTHLDPMCYDSETDRRNARVVIDACKPFARRDSFPVVARSSKDLDARIRAKWAADLPKGF